MNPFFVAIACLVSTSATPADSTEIQMQSNNAARQYLSTSREETLKHGLLKMDGYQRFLNNPNSINETQIG